MTYKQRVFLRAWRDYKIKKNHGYGDWSFAQSLYWSHRLIKTLISNGL